MIDLPLIFGVCVYVYTKNPTMCGVNTSSSTPADNPQANLSVHRTGCCPALTGSQPSTPREQLLGAATCRQQEGSRHTDTIPKFTPSRTSGLFYSEPSSTQAPIFFPCPTSKLGSNHLLCPTLFHWLILGRCIALNL